MFGLAMYFGRHAFLGIQKDALAKNYMHYLIILAWPRDIYGGPSAAERSTRAVITYIDFVAAFGSASHRFLDESMAETKCRHKTRAIYRSATAQVWVQPPGGEDPIKTKPFEVNRGAVQGDLFSPLPVCFIVALECFMRKADEGGG